MISKAMVSKIPSQQATNSKYTTLALPRGNRNLQSMSGSTHANGLTIRTLTKAAVRPQPKITDSNPLLRISSSLKLRKSIRRAKMPNLFVLRVLQKQLQKSQPIHMMTSQSDKEMYQNQPVVPFTLRQRDTNISTQHPPAHFSIDQHT